MTPQTPRRSGRVRKTKSYEDYYALSGDDEGGVAEPLTPPPSVKRAAKSTKRARLIRKDLMDEDNLYDRMEDDRMDKDSTVVPFTLTPQASLLGLPVELIWHVAHRYLNVESVMKLGMTCRLLNACVETEEFWKMHLTMRSIQKSRRTWRETALKCLPYYCHGCLGRKLPHPVEDSYVCLRCSFKSRITLTRAKSEFRLPPAELNALDYDSVLNPHYRSAAMMKLFNTVEVFELASEYHKEKKELKKLKQTELQQKQFARKQKERERMQLKKTELVSRLENAGVPIPISGSSSLFDSFIEGRLDKRFSTARVFKILKTTHMLHDHSAYPDMIGWERALTERFNDIEVEEVWEREPAFTEAMQEVEAAKQASKKVANPNMLCVCGLPVRV